MTTPLTDPAPGSRSRTGRADAGRPEPASPEVPRSKRWALASLGVVAVGLGGLGVFVPGLPTTVFLILASWCFTRSCPWLEDRLIKNRLFAPYLPYLSGRQPMPRKARITALAMMWTFVAASTLWTALTAPPWVPALIVAAGLAGTVAILRFRR